MLLQEKEIHQGDWLFRRRGWLPVALLPVLIPSLLNSSYIGGSHSLDLIWEICCLAVSLLGLSIRCFSVGYVPENTSGRNTKNQIADVLNTTGIYSVLRNPLYFGNYLMMFGVVLFFHSIWICLVFSLVFWLYYERIIIAEEDFLFKKFGDEYAAYAKQTPAFLPSFKNWKPPLLSFSWKTVLHREYSGFFVVFVCFFVFEVFSDTFSAKKLVFDPVWLVLFLMALSVFLLLRFLKKKTKFLTEEGRC